MTSVSIIIPVYNVEKYIAACLRSVMAQTYTGPMECIIIDDCGADNSIVIAQELLQDYQGPISFHILHHDHNRGLSAARNTGMDAATGDYLCFVDSDDEITTDSIEQLVTALGDEQYDIVVGDITAIGDDTQHEILRMKLTDGTVLHGRDIVSCYKRCWNMMAQAKLYNAAFIRRQQLRFKEGLIHEDELWSFEVACTASMLKAVQHPTYIYYIREGSITANSNKDKRRKIEILKIIAEEMTSFMKSRHIVFRSAYMIVQKFIEEMLQYEKSDRQHFRQTYLDLRRKSHFSWFYRIRVKGLDIRSQIQELHYFLPPSLGERYKYWRITK